jgi:hypothetical protein
MYSVIFKLLSLKCDFLCRILHFYPEFVLTQPEIRRKIVKTMLRLYRVTLEMPEMVLQVKGHLYA